MSTEPTNARCHHYHELAAHFVMSALTNPKIMDATAIKGLESTMGFKKLVGLGCDADTLRECVSYAAALVGLAPAVEIEKLRELTAAIKKVLEGFRDLMPSRLLPLDTGDGKTFDLVPISGDLHVPAELRQELARKALVCAHLLEYCEKNPIPRRDDLAQLAISWPALYVESVTGSYHFAFVADLLEKAELGRRSESSLSKSMKQARQKFESVLPFMVPSLKFWKLAQGLGELVDENSANDSTDQPRVMRLRRVDDQE